MSNTAIDAPIEICIGTLFLYNLLGINLLSMVNYNYQVNTLLGVSCFFGLAVTCLFLPMNHFAGKVVVRAQENLMKARDERVALMNEILGAIRMLKVKNHRHYLSLSDDDNSHSLWLGNEALKVVFLLYVTKNSDFSASIILSRHCGMLFGKNFLSRWISLITHALGMAHLFS